MVANEAKDLGRAAWLHFWFLEMLSIILFGLLSKVYLDHKIEKARAMANSILIWTEAHNFKIPDANTNRYLMGYK